MNEKDWLERLRKEGEQIQVPKNLEPESIREILEKKKKRKHNWKIAAAAAVLLILCGGIGIGSHYNGNIQEPEKEQKGSYGEIYDLLKELSPEYDNVYISEDAVLADMEVSRAGTKESTRRTSDVGASGRAFSGTNLQTEEVDEGDVVKTDGDCIYILDQNYNTITTVRAKDGHMKRLSVITLKEELFPNEFYVAGDKLCVLGSVPQGKHSGEKTAVCTYDISDREKPVEAGTVLQSGAFSSSRMKENCLYVFSSFYPVLPDNKDRTKEYIPQADGELLDLSNIVIPQHPETPGYLVMSAIDLKKPDRSCDKKAVFSSAETFYVSQNNIYTASMSGQDRRNTEIRKFSYGNGEIQYESRGSVKGYLESSFSMDEYKGNLRLVTTLDTVGGGTYNNVYVLDKNMKTAGSILKLAKDERIYSARFMGDEGYFVTFRETDPLFSVDFSNPADPRVIGQLKIPGFSEYLHFYENDKLLGIGMEANEKGETGGIKLSMFDTADPKNVKEEKKYVMKDAYDAEVLSNHHAILIDPEKNLFGFAVITDQCAKYCLFKYEKKGFRSVFSRKLGNSSYGIRGLYIDDTFYLVQDHEITAYDMENYKKIARIAM